MAAGSPGAIWRFVHMNKEIFRTAVSDKGDAVVVTCVCPSCGEESPTGSRFCGHCGTDMAAAGIPALDKAACVLVRAGSGQAFVRVAPVAGQGPSDEVRVALPPVSNADDPVFGLERDKYVLFGTAGGSPRIVGCPFGRTGFCSEDGKAPCRDLGGWLCMELPSGERVACAALCHGAVGKDSFSF